MDFTFGIITGGSQNHREDTEENLVVERIKKIISTIELQNIPNYEIIIVGGPNQYENINNLRHVPFDDKRYFGWITKKKNIITNLSKFENIVFMHDYYSLDENWYNDMLSYGNDFNLLMNRIFDINGQRYNDWEIVNVFGNADTLLPYDVKDLQKFMYFSGGFWIAKKKVMTEFLLDERLRWGNGEDVEWSDRVKKKYIFELNYEAKIKLLKPRFISSNRRVITEEQIEILRSKK
jgi:hypothetical protein